MSCVLLNLLFLFVHITWLTVVSAQTTASPEFYDYNRISFTQLDNIDELKRHFFNYITPNGDESEGISNTNLVVGVATDSCMHKLLNCSAFKGIQRFAGGDVLSAVSLPWTELFPVSPLSACAELFFYPFGTPISEPKYRHVDLSYRSVTEWGKTVITHTNALFHNDFDFSLDIYWLDDGKGEKFQGTVHSGESWRITTHIGHIFVAREAIDRSNAKSRADRLQAPNPNPIVDFMVVKESNYRFGPINRLETCELITNSHPTRYTKNVDESKLPIQFVEGQISCEDMKLRLTEFSHQVWYHRRLGLNYVQPKLVHPVTSNGFEKRKLPAETYQWLKEWYEKERPRIETTEKVTGPSMNQHVAPSGITHLTSELKMKLAEELRHIHEGWYGGDLTMTSIYGIRKYTNGSVLRMHVDTANTHVVSSIINVDQSVRKDWPLLILDHYGNEHNVTMEPGDMVLYESAKLLHGRPEPMDGDHYDNIFIHYQPVSGWDYKWI